MDVSRVLGIDGRSTGLRVGIASRWLARARGWWPGAGRRDFDVLQLPCCRAVHSFGMRTPLDVAFTDAEGRVTSMRHALPPWRIARDASACCTWELRPGAARRFGLRVGSRLSAMPRQRGATALEFLLAAMSVVIPLSMAVLETAQLAAARHLLHGAVHEASRQAAIGDMSDAGIRRSLAVAILPLFAPLDPRAALDAGDVSGGRDRLSAPAGLAALARSQAEMYRPDLSEIGLEALDGEGRAWRLRVRYCRELHFPLVRHAIPAVLRIGAVTPFDQACLARQRMPLEAWALVLRSTGLPEPPPPAS